MTKQIKVVSWYVNGLASQAEFERRVNIALRELNGRETDVEYHQVTTRGAFGMDTRLTAIISYWGKAPKP